MLMRYWQLPVQKLRFQEWLLALSTASMTMLMSWRGGFPMIVLGVVCSFFISLVLMRRIRLASIIADTSRIWLCVSAIFTLVCDIQLVRILYGEYGPILGAMKRFIIQTEQLELVRILCTVGLGIMASYAIFSIFSASLPRIYHIAKRFAASLDAVEKRYMICFLSVGAIVLILAYSLTNCFYLPINKGVLVEYDVIYTADTGVLVNNNAYLNIGAIQNDINQMLFGLAAMPLAVISTLVSWAFFFIPNSYSYALGLLHLPVLGVTLLLISRMLRLQGMSKYLFLGLMTVSYPTLLFMLTLEQYIISVFWLIVFLYSVLMKRPERDILFLGAVGTLMTGGVLFPLAINGKKLKEAFIELIWMGLCFTIIVTVFGKLPYLLNIFAKQGELIGWYGGNSQGFQPKLLQFINFIAGCFFAPQSYVALEGSFPRFVLSDVFQANPLGIALLFLSVVGYFLYRKELFARICGGWILFSFFILCIIGWGTSENGLVLYSLYFGWAYIALCFMALEKISSKWLLLKRSLQGALIVLVLITNIQAIIQIIQFGMAYYPA